MPKNWKKPVKMKRVDTYSLVLIALFAAILSVLSILPIPIVFLGVPMTLQTFAVAFCGFLLGWKRGLASVGIYLLLGSIGVPVFSGMRGGVQQFLGPTGGFLYGFLLMVLLCGLIPTRVKPAFQWVFGILCGIAGLCLCHACGVIHLAAVAHVSVGKAILGASLPYLPKDLVSVILAFALRKRIKQI